VRLRHRYSRSLLVLDGVLAGALPGIYLSGVAAEVLWPVLPIATTLAGAWRGVTVRVRETGDGLVVRNLFRTYSVAWADVTEIGWYPLLWHGHEVAPGLRVRGARFRVRVMAMIGCLDPPHEHEATVRRWAERLAPLDGA
jgi:hypothetical protein